MSHSTTRRITAGGVYNLTPGAHHSLSNALVSNYFDNNDQFKRYGVHEDGSCFFHTICAAKNINDYRNRTHEERAKIGRQFRKKIRKRVSKQNWDSIWKRRGVTQSKGRLPEVETIKHMLGNHTTWADVYIILYVMDKININMLFFDLSSDSIYCGVRGLEAGNQDSILVAWVNRAHFEPIFRKHETDSDMDMFLYPSTDPFVKRIMARYDSELCKHTNDITDII